jgi:hypothetical protein
MEHIASRLAQIPGVIAVTLGGSRARGTERRDSDWDFGLYCQGSIDAADVQALGWPGQVTGPGGWGPVVNGGAWLTIEGERVDLCYRDLDEVVREIAEAEEGRFGIEHLPNYVAGIPTYIVVGELALCRVLVGDLPRPNFPDALARTAPLAWRQQGSMTLHTAEVHAKRGDVIAAVANMARATITEGQARLAEERQWVLNEKGIIDLAGLGDARSVFLNPGSLPSELSDSADLLRAILNQEGGTKPR